MFYAIESEILKKYTATNVLHMMLKGIIISSETISLNFSLFLFN